MRFSDGCQHGFDWRAGDGLVTWIRIRGGCLHEFREPRVFGAIQAPNRAHERFKSRAHQSHRGYIEPAPEKVMLTKYMLSHDRAVGEHHDPSLSRNWRMARPSLIEFGD
jgi:hypothetical protein